MSYIRIHTCAIGSWPVLEQAALSLCSPWLPHCADFVQVPALLPMETCAHPGPSVLLWKVSGFLNPLCEDHMEALVHLWVTNEMQINPRQDHLPSKIKHMHRKTKYLYNTVI